MIFLAIGSALLAGLFVLLKPADTVAPVAAPAPAASASAAPAMPPPPPAPRVFELRVEKGRLVSGPTVIQVRQGEPVELRITSDRADELHLHGYDLHLALHANEPATLSFSADRSGRFDYELHHANLELGALEVQPQ